MKTQELKAYIDKVLGNSLRVLLPSYWWKRLFLLVVDKVEDSMPMAKEFSNEFSDDFAR